MRFATRSSRSQAFWNNWGIPGHWFNPRHPPHIYAVIQPLFQKTVPETCCTHSSRGPQPRSEENCVHAPLSQFSDFCLSLIMTSIRCRGVLFDLDGGLV